MIFDQYSRYKACSYLLRQTGFVAGNSVLDIGSGPECLFGKFMPDTTMSYVDPLIPIGSGQGRIIGNVFASELDGQSFDCVSAVDVLEHVPPEYRQAFLERMSLLGKNTLILGFPTSDSSDALETDKALDDQYRAIFGHDYSWLEEHYRYGLPSLAETVEQLTQMGWHCQSVGHGHAPWIRELLGFVICVWDIPSLSNVVLAISAKFNRELYPYDFRPPYYRQFVIASRSPVPHIDAPVANNDIEAADNAFRALMEDAKQQYFPASLRQLAEQDAQIVELNRKIEEVSVWSATLQATVAERDGQIASLNQVTSEREDYPPNLTQSVAHRDAEIAVLKQLVTSRERQLHALYQSLSWRITASLRFLYRTFRQRGLVPNDRKYLGDVFKQRFRFWKPKQAESSRELPITKIQLPTDYLADQGTGVADIFVWAVIDWHFRIQRPQQLSTHLAKEGRRVFYFSNNFINSEKSGFQVESLDDEDRLFRIQLNVSGAPAIYYSPPSHEAISQLREGMALFFEWSKSKEVLNIVQHSYWYGLASTLPNSSLIYDCMDHHEGFGNVTAEILALEQTMAKNADLLVVTSQWLDDALKNINQHREVVRNACQYEHFASSPAAVYRDSKNRKIIGYYGAIAEWFDLELVKKVASAHPDCVVLLIGADTCNAATALSGCQNVVFTGEVPYANLPFYLHAFDVCLLPFHIIPLTLATNPVKLYEYLSAGKSVVVVDLPEMRQFGDLIRVGANHVEFLVRVDEALNAPVTQEDANLRKAFASQQTWAHRAQQLIKAIDARPQPSVSVVVVTYNNLEFTKACLYSLEIHSDYPNTEIIVVDNASSDGSREFLQNWVNNSAHYKLILNGDNKGFAAANNQGLVIATGDYLVLLNNDTYVTPGWIRTMVNHLRRDPTIGILGPVTNNIGNEAKIDISYISMAEMLAKSAVYTHRHIGQTFPLRTAAFFSVMMSRATYECVGTLDEAFGRGFFEDDDYCRRVEEIGLRVVCAEDVFVHHHLSASFDKMKLQDRQILFEQNKATYEAKWGKWVPHEFRKNQNFVAVSRQQPSVFSGQQDIGGQCNVCGKKTHFFYQDVALWRESLNCEHCRTTSRYRSITQGVLRAISELTGNKAFSLATLPRTNKKKLRVYDTQPPFYYEPCAYPLPDLLKATGWIEVELSQYKPKRPMGKVLAKGVTNQNLECLTFADESLDIVITSDVMEHVLLDDRAHREIYRVLKPSGIYIFTVPHNRAWGETLIRVQITDPDDPSKDVHLLEPEYHGDTNSDEGACVLAYRTYGKDVETQLENMGFEVEYIREDIEGLGILNTELYYCRKTEI